VTRTERTYSRATAGIYKKKKEKWGGVRSDLLKFLSGILQDEREVGKD